MINSPAFTEVGHGPWRLELVLDPCLELRGGASDVVPVTRPGVQPLGNARSTDPAALPVAKAGCGVGSVVRGHSVCFAGSTVGVGPAVSALPELC